MKNTFLFLVTSVCIITMSACKSEAKTETTESVATTPAPLPYPALGNEAIGTLYSQADKVDIIFYDLPISVNQDNPASVKNTVLYVSPAAPNITGNCKPLGRLTWMQQGNIIREADIYCDTGCEYLLFMQDNKPFAANAMGPAGVAFFKNVISQVEKQKQQ
jgi:hypothetical protein